MKKEKKEKIKFREFFLSSGTKIILGKDAKSNDVLMNLYKNKNNIILHTVSPGSPFCIIENNEPTQREIYEAGIFVARYSQDWRDNKKDVLVNVFTGKDISKTKELKPGTWNVKKSKTIKIKKEDIENIIKNK
jgi:predicted ribosome quality control (RQC) complex YloA/Tae2 family protein